MCSRGSKHVLLLGGVGYFSLEEDWLIQRLQTQFRDLPADVRAVHFDAQSTADLLRSGHTAAIVVSSVQEDCEITGFGSDGNNERFCSDKQWLHVLADWVRSGGQLFFMTGEGDALMHLFDKTFNRKWKHSGRFYRRVELELRPDVAPSSTQAQLPAIYCSGTKTCMLAGVAADEALYTPSERYDGDPAYCGVAVASVGLGRLAYLGDVNCLDSSVDIVKYHICEALCT